MTIEDILDSRLGRREAAGTPEWRVWEHKTLNIHRGVLRRILAHGTPSMEEIARSVREQARASFHVSWWRGFAFGALVEVPSIPKDILTIDSVIDVRDNSKGTWQWVLLVCPSVQIAVGIHTWTEGYLSPVYRGLLDLYQSEGWEVGHFKKEKDQLMKFLTGAAKLKGLTLAEFER